MIHRKHLAIVVVALVSGLVAWPTPAQNECVDFSEYAIIATDSVQIDQNAKVLSGNVAANESSGTVSLGKKVLVAADVWADSLTVENNATIGGTAFCNELDDSTGDVTCTSFVPPVFDQLPVLQAAVPGDEDVTLSNSETVVLTPERGYGDITGGMESTVIFEPGVYDVRSIFLAHKGDLLFRGPTEIRVAESVNLGQECDVRSEAGFAVDASEVVFHVGGDVSLGRKSTVSANFYAPDGTLELPSDIDATGAFLARDVVVGSKAQIELDSAFTNEPPVADAQTVVVSSDDPVTIELTGSDPEAQSLSFSIVVAPTAGTLGPITEIQDPGQCSETVQACTQDSDCPGVETCVLPPITRATVDYDPNGCTTDPEGELTCPEDSFTFGVTDPCALLGTAVVSINPEDPSDPPPGLDEVDAVDVQMDVVADTSSEFVLSAGQPEDVLELTFAVETLPAGGLTDSDGTPITSVPFDLPSAVLTYDAPSQPGTDSFTFSARDATTGSPPCNAPSCDMATVNIGIDVARELAEDLEVETVIDVPIQITLEANPGGSGGGSAPVAHQMAGGPGETFGYSAAPIATGTNNGALAESGPQALAALNLPFDAGWSSTTAKPPAFFWSGTIPVFADDSYTFTGPGCLSVTDDFQPGDQFNIYDNGQLIGTTPAVGTGPDVEVGPDAAYLDPAYSSGSFDVEGAGFHEITIELIGDSLSGGRGYIRVDTGSCRPNLEVTSFDAPDSVVLDEPIGDQITTTVINNGFADIPAGTSASIGYYISTDSSIETDDRLLVGGRENLSQQAPGGLAVGESVAIDLFDGANVGSAFPDGEPPTGNVFIGVLVDEFDDIAETDEADNDASQPIEVRGDTGAQLTWTVTALPQFGTLTDTSGSPITVGQTFSATPTVVYTPNPGFTGSDSFTYEVAEATITDTALVAVLVQASGDCLEDGICDNGRGDGGGGQLPDTEAGPGLTVVVEGPGVVSSNPRQIRGGAAVGLFCGDTCTAHFPDGALVALFARPVGAGSEFVGWAGACRGSDPVTTVRMTTATSCRALFRKVEER